MRAVVEVAGVLAMRFVLIFLITAGLSGCFAPTNEAFVGASGSKVQTVKCSQSPQGCYQEASKVCGGPYQVLDSDSHAGGLVADVMPGPFTWYTMTYNCGPSDGRLASFAFKGQQYVPPAQSSPSFPSTTNCQRMGNTVNCQSF